MKKYLLYNVEAIFEIFKQSLVIIATTFEDFVLNLHTNIRKNISK